METEMGAFLRAEESANELLSNLERLKDEIDGYSRAKGTLEDVRDQLVSLVQSLGQMAERSTSVMAALEQIGTPEILREIENTQNQMSEHVVGLKQQIDSLSKTLTNDITKVGKQVKQQGKAIKLMIGIGLPLVAIVVSVVLFLIKSS